MRYFSMFSGIGGFDLALNNQGHECVGYSEIDKYAIQIYEKHFCRECDFNTEKGWRREKLPKNYGDATKIRTDELPDFDFLCGGFPCQTFSIAGKRRGFEDTRGTMFFEIARILKAKRPKNFLLENVKGLLNHDKGKTFATILQTLDELGYDFEWMVLNSKFFGVPQNRERVFIIGSLRGTSRPEILPFGANNTKINKTQSCEVSRTLNAGYYKLGNISSYIKSKTQHSRVYNINGVSPTLAGASKLSGDCTPKIITPVLTPNRENKRQNGRRFKENGEEMFTLTGQDIHGVAILDLYNNKEHIDRSPALTEPHHNTLRVREGFRIRRLTPTECERLQGFPDGWTEGVSDTQRYKTLGNAVTVNVIESLMEKMKDV